MIIQQRGKNVALVGAIIQLVMAAVVMGVFWYTSSEAAMVSAYLAIAGVPLWLMAALLFYCRQLEQREAMEVEELAAAGASGSAIFDQKAGDLRPAAARMKFMNRWIAPGFTIAWAAIQAMLALLALKFLAGKGVTPVMAGAPGALFMFMAAFAGFLFGRYAVGMSERPEWRVLRATGSYMTVNVLFVAIVAGTLLLDSQGYADMAVAFAVAIVQAVLAIEMVLNFTLDLYRPRMPHQEQRHAFDSRLFNLVAQPGKVGHSLAEAINYQFGFEVSKSWFYQLAGRAFLPLMAFGAMILVAMSSVVIVESNEQYVVMHLGKPDTAPLGPGIHFKWPWPIDTARRFDVGKVHKITLGVGAQRSDEQRAAAFVKGKELALWLEEHGAMEEKDFLIAAPPRARLVVADDIKPPPPVDLIKLVVRLEYRIDDVYKFGFNFTDAHSLLECMASQEMVRYCATATLDDRIGGGNDQMDGDRPEAIMTSGRQAAADGLKQRIQAAVDEVSLGVRITYVGMEAVHPPSKVAPEFEKGIEAALRAEERRFQAEGDAHKMLAEVAGDVTSALKLAAAIRQQNELESLRGLIADTKRMERRLQEITDGILRQVKSLQEEIDHEVLLGRIHATLPETSGAGGSTDGDSLARASLLKTYKDHLALLREIRGQLDGGQDVTQVIGQSLSKAAAQVDRLFTSVSGRPATIIAEAQARRYKRELDQMALAEMFHYQVAAYNACPSVFMGDRAAEVWNFILPDARKVVIAGRSDNLELWLNWGESGGGLSDITFEPRK